MQRPVALALTFFSALLIAGCGSALSPPSEPELAALDSLGSRSEQHLALVDSMERFGLELLEQEAQANPEGNIVISPLSIHDALTMTLNGARGQTATQMRTALCLDELELEQANQAWADLITRLHRKKDAEIGIANSLWLRSGIEFEPAFLETNRDYFAADAATLSDDPEDGAEEINRWVDERTAGRIQELVGPIDPSVVLVLINTVYVKAGWELFEEADTSDEPFTLPDGEQVDVPTMHAEIGADVTETDAYLALPLTANGLVTLNVVVPKEDRTPESLLPLLADGGLDALSTNMESEPYVVDLSLPRFRARFKDQAMGAALQDLGMSRAFSPDEAQFGGIAPGPLWIAQVVHEALLDVNEEGIEAAAGTAVEMATGYGPTEHLTVRIDRPFLVVLSDLDTDTPLFMAIVRDPR